MTEIRGRVVARAHAHFCEPQASSHAALRIPRSVARVERHGARRCVPIPGRCTYPRTAADTKWEPLAATPAYPEYVSGYSGVAGAFSRALEDVLGTRHLGLTLTPRPHRA